MKKNLKEVRKSASKIDYLNLYMNHVNMIIVEFFRVIIGKSYFGVVFDMYKILFKSRIIISKHKESNIDIKKINKILIRYQKIYNKTVVLVT